LLFFVLVCCPLWCAAQNLSLDPGTPDSHPQTPTVWFQRAWPDARPQKITIVVDSTGERLYWSSSGAELQRSSAAGTMSAQSLTRLFTGISATIEFGERLKVKYRYDKLGLLPEISAMADASSNGWLEEVQIVAPLLKTIANDGTVLHMARMKAAQILAKAGIP